MATLQQVTLCHILGSVCGTTISYHARMEFILIQKCHLLFGGLGQGPTLKLMSPSSVDHLTWWALQICCSDSNSEPKSARRDFTAWPPAYAHFHRKPPASRAPWAATASSNFSGPGHTSWSVAHPLDTTPSCANELCHSLEVPPRGWSSPSRYRVQWKRANHLIR